MLEYLGLKVSSTGFSSIGAQKAATNAGYSIDYEITFVTTNYSIDHNKLSFRIVFSYDELAKLNTDWDFCGTETERYIQMSMITA